MTLLNKVIKEVAEDINLPYEEVKDIYMAFWKVIKINVESLPLKKDLTEEEFQNLTVNFNIPFLGKLYCTYPQYLKLRKSYIKNKRRNAKTKENKTNV